MLNHPFQIHQNDRQQQARSLGLSLQEFDRLVDASNFAYETFYNLGPFYGKEEIKEPTFRVTAEAIKLPLSAKKILIELGNDLLFLGRALKSLPAELKARLGDDLDYNLPPSWRIDVIIQKDGKLRVNEIEGRDGANALMMAEQLAYNLIPFSESTAAKLIPALQAMCGNKSKLKIALVRVDIINDAYTPNAERFIAYLKDISNGDVIVDHLNETDIRSGVFKPDWNKYDGIMNEGSLSPLELFNLGVDKKQLLSAGNYNALVNKGTIALVFDESLNGFWEETIGKERLGRLRKILISSKFIDSKEELEIARQGKKVVKVSWAGSDIFLVNRSKGVALPEGALVQSSPERWKLLSESVEQGLRIVSQEFVMPAKLPAYLRKRGTSLEYVEWYNRLCVKFVADGDPNRDANSVSLTAAEVTLGPDIVPAGRACALTAAAFGDL